MPRRDNTALTESRTETQEQTESEIDLLVQNETETETEREVRALSGRGKESQGLARRRKPFQQRETPKERGQEKQNEGAPVVEMEERGRSVWTK